MDFGSLPLSLVHRVDLACDDFEAAWRWAPTADRERSGRGGRARAVSAPTRAAGIGAGAASEAR